VDVDGHTVNRMKKWVTAVAVVVALAGVGFLAYWQWDSIWAFVFSPIGGFVAKILFTGKALKVAIGVAFAVGAGAIALRKKLRRGEPEPELAPPVYGPPEEDPPPAPAPPAEIMSGGTATATTTDPATVPAPRPI
jgi:hypothetical protein